MILENYWFDLVHEDISRNLYPGERGIHRKIIFGWSLLWNVDSPRSSKTFYYCWFVSTFELMSGRNYQFDFFHQDDNQKIYTNGRGLDSKKLLRTLLQSPDSLKIPKFGLSRLNMIPPEVENFFSVFEGLNFFHQKLVGKLKTSSWVSFERTTLFSRKTSSEIPKTPNPAVFFISIFNSSLNVSKMMISWNKVSIENLTLSMLNLWEISLTLSLASKTR